MGRPVLLKVAEKTNLILAKAVTMHEGRNNENFMDEPESLKEMIDKAKKAKTIKSGQMYKFTSGPFKGMVIKIVEEHKEHGNLGVWKINLKDSKGEWINPLRDLMFSSQIINHCKPYIRLGE